MTQGPHEAGTEGASATVADHGTDNHVNLLVCHLFVSFHTPLEAELVVRIIGLHLLVYFEQLVMDQGTVIIFDRLLVLYDDKKYQKLHEKPSVHA